MENRSGQNLSKLSLEKLLLEKLLIISSFDGLSFASRLLLNKRHEPRAKVVNAFMKTPNQCVGAMYHALRCCAGLVYFLHIIKDEFFVITTTYVCCLYFSYWLNHLIFFL